MSAPIRVTGSRATGARQLRKSMRRADFLRVSELGRRLSTRYFLVLTLERRQLAERLEKEPGFEPQPDLTIRLGITVTRRVGKAVRRNRIKRLVREWFRSSLERLQDGWQGYDLVVIAKREIPESLMLADVTSDLDRALRARSGSGSARSSSPRGS